MPINMISTLKFCASWLKSMMKIAFFDSFSKTAFKNDVGLYLKVI